MAKEAKTTHPGARALTIGAFDGVHRGHRALIEAARRAVGDGGHVEVLTFDPPPGRVLAGPRAGPSALMTLALRREALLAAGADEVTVIATDEGLLSLSAEDFIDRWIVPREVSVIVEGRDFRFGRGRTGTLQLLEDRGVVDGGSVHAIEETRAPLGDGTSVPVRSGTIRWLLRAGRVRDAARLLGRFWRAQGDVVEGAKRGRTLGVPTANLDTGDLVVPLEGVYMGVGHPPQGPPRPAAISIGRNPTFDDRHRSFEVHLLDWDGPLGDYGWSLQVELTGWIRDQVTCGDVESLKALIERDLEQVRAAATARDYAVAP